MAKWWTKGIEPSPNEGAFRWAFHKTRDRLNRFLLGGVVLGLASIPADLALVAPETPSGSQQAWNNLAKVLAAVGAVVFLGYVFSLIRAPYEQRDHLRQETRSRVRDSSALDPPAPAVRLATLASAGRQLLQEEASGAIVPHVFQQRADAYDSSSTALVGDVSPNHVLLLMAWQVAPRPEGGPESAAAMRARMVWRVGNLAAGLDEIALRIRARAGENVGEATFRRVGLADLILNAHHQLSFLQHREAPTEDFLAWEAELIALLDRAAPALEAQRALDRSTFDASSMSSGNLDAEALGVFVVCGRVCHEFLRGPVEPVPDFDPRDWHGRWRA